MPEAGVSPRRGLVLALLVLSLAVGTLLSDTLFGDKLLSQADALEAFPPWSDALAEPAEPANPLLLDQSIVMQPWQHFAAERLADGTPPLWNPHNYAGQPMVGTYQTAYFWPLHWVYYAWPSERYWAWSAALRLLAAGGFTFLLLRTLGRDVLPATLGAVVFALSGFMIAWLGHMHTHVALFLPALFWLVERIAQRPGRTRDTVGLVLCVGGALLAGHLQTAVHMALAVLAWTAFRAVCAVGDEGRGARLGARGLGQVVVGGVLGVALALPQLLPFFDYLGDSAGAVVLEEVQTVDDIDPLDAAVLMVDPGRFGSPAAAQGFGPYRGPKGANVNYSELIGGYVGTVALALALLALLHGWRERRGRALLVFFAGLALFSAALAWQVYPIYDLVAEVPRLKSTKLMRFGLVLTLGLAVLAAWGAELLLARLRARDPRLALAGGVLLVGLVAGELVAFGRGYNPAIDPADKAPATAVTDFLRAELPKDGSPAPWRVLGIEGRTLMPSANLFYDVPMVGGYDSMELRTTTELVGLMSSSPGADVFIKMTPYYDQGWPIAHLLGVRYVLAGMELPAPLELVLDGPTKVYRNPAALPKAFAARAARLVPDAEERLAVLGDPAFDPWVAVLEAAPALEVDLDAPLAAAAVELVRYADLEVDLAVDVPAGPNPALVVLADAWDDEWVAELDGEPVEVARVDHGLRGVWVPAGRHELAFRYVPYSLMWGVGLALGILGAAGAWLVVRTVRSRTRGLGEEVAPTASPPPANGLSSRP